MTAATSPSDPIVELLAHERAAFLAALERVPAERRAERPAPDRWSALEIAEHVARLDVSMTRVLAMKAGEPRLSPEECAEARMTPRLAAALRDRSVRIEAPDRVHPKGGLEEDAVHAQMGVARTALLAAYRAADPAVLDGTTFPHPVFGPVTMRGWIELLAHHDARHAQQLAEIAGAAAA